MIHIRAVNRAGFHHGGSIVCVAHRSDVSFARGNPLDGSSLSMLPRLKTQPPPSSAPARSESDRRTLIRTGEKSTQGDSNGFAAARDAT
jgi:hypothetical protein